MESKVKDNNKYKCDFRKKTNSPLNCERTCMAYKAISTLLQHPKLLKENSKHHIKTTHSCSGHHACMNEIELWKHVPDLKDNGLRKNLSVAIKRKPHHTTLIFALLKKLPLFEQNQTFYTMKYLNSFPSAAKEIRIR